MFQLQNLPVGQPPQWTYNMRREMQEIIPNLYLGPYAAATKRNFGNLKELGFTHIVCVRQVVERNVIRPNFPDEFQYLIVEMADNYLERIIPHCKNVCAFLQNCLDNGGKALVHGNGGACRSAALVIAFIMFRYNVTAIDALKHVQSRRFCINPNENFMAQLQEFEPIYRAQAVVPRPSNSSTLKRSIEDCDPVSSCARPGPAPNPNFFNGSSSIPADEEMDEMQ